MLKFGYFIKVSFYRIYKYQKTDASTGIHRDGILEADLN